MRSRFGGWMVAVGIGVIVVGTIALLLFVLPVVRGDARVADGEGILEAAYRTAYAVGPLQSEVLRGLKDGGAQLPFTFTGELTGTDVLAAASPAGPMVVQFTRNGRIEGLDSLGQEQVVEGDCAFQLLVGEDPKDPDVVALAETLVSACGDPTVEVGPPSEWVTPTVGEPEPVPHDQSFGRGWPYLDSTDPCCGNEFSVAVTGPHELRFVETFTDTQSSWEVVEIWKPNNLPARLAFGGIEKIERGWDSEGPWVIVHIWTWDSNQELWTTLEHKFLTAEMFSRTSIYECEPVASGG